uniref:Uncharacterized protein n=1 Tax=Micrurus carvalhoi TaxID=3147026 RepID=A0A2H6NHE7_9SAUR
MEKLIGSCMSQTERQISYCAGSGWGEEVEEAREKVCEATVGCARGIAWIGRVQGSVQEMLYGLRRGHRHELLVRMIQMQRSWRRVHGWGRLTSATCNSP